MGEGFQVVKGVFTFVMQKEKLDLCKCVVCDLDWKGRVCVQMVEDVTWGVV